VKQSEPEGEGRGTRDGSPGDRRSERQAGVGVSILFTLIPPLGGAVLGGLLLTDASRVPWVLVTSFLVTLVGFLMVGPLGRRSLGFSIASYRRATELAVLVGLTSAALVVYTLVIYLLLDFRTPWMWTVMEGVGLA